MNHDFAALLYVYPCFITSQGLIFVRMPSGCRVFHETNESAIPNFDYDPSYETLVVQFRDGSRFFRAVPTLSYLLRVLSEISAGKIAYWSKEDMRTLLSAWGLVAHSLNQSLTSFTYREWKALLTDLQFDYREAALRLSEEIFGVKQRNALRLC